MTRKQAAAKGGRATLALYGREHFRELGRKGFSATVAAHWSGDRLAYRQYLAARSWNAVVSQLADLELDRCLAAGAEVAVVEIPYIEGEEEPW